MPNPYEIADYSSSLFRGLSGFWQRFFKDTRDLEAFYQASEQYLGQVYLDLLANVLNTSIDTVPIFNRESWKLFAITENELSYLEGATAADDRFLYDMPGTTVDADILQNSIVEPTVTYEKDLDFETVDNDGYLRFVRDPFREVLSSDGVYTPAEGVAWRWMNILVGNSFRDNTFTGSWVTSTNVRRGDTLRVMAYMGAVISEGSLTSAPPNPGRLVYTGTLTFTVLNNTFTALNLGDVIEVNVDALGAAYGRFIIKEVLSPTAVILEETFGIPLITTTATLGWRLHKASYYDYASQDYEIDYFEEHKYIGKSATPYPVADPGPYVYAVIREPADDSIEGLALAAGMGPFDLGTKHLKPGSVFVYAPKLSGGNVVEGEDYTVDYFQGIIAPFSADWDPAYTATRCSFRYYGEVLYSASGVSEVQTEGSVRQLALWVPEVLVDRFTLYNNFGSLLNRFEASSETYRAFLKGLMYLYMSGPILQRVNAALNVAAGFPVIQSDGETFVSYDGGLTGSGADGVFTALTQTFYSASYTFESQDTGGYIVVTGAINDINRSKFRILEVVDTHTVGVEATFGVIDEIGMDWEFSREYKKIVTTLTVGEQTRTYKYPYNVTLKSEIVAGTATTFSAFDYLTTAFTVTDYIEDATWWHNKYIPAVLWANTAVERRLATSTLVKHTFDPVDGGCFDDPGLYFDASDDGIVVAPTVPGGGLAPLYRRSAAFLLFDRFLKFHMFYIAIDENIEITEEFSDDLTNLILIAKPSYTYPYVEPGATFRDLGALLEEFWISGINFSLTEDLATVSRGILFDHDILEFDDYYRYVRYTDTITGATAPSVPFVLPRPEGLRQYFVALKLGATIGGVQVVEGVDYTIDFDPISGTYGTVTPITVWDAGAILYTALTVVLLNPSDGLIDTTIGYTPLAVDGTDPTYLRDTAADQSMVDRALTVTIDTGDPGPGTSYIYV
jgi:hypothetical protein